MGFIIVLIIAAIVFILRSFFKTYIPNDPLEQYKKKQKTIVPITYNFKKSQVSKDIYAEILDRKFLYFQKLNQVEKAQFLKRLDVFIKTHKFIPAEMSEVTVEMKVMISACAIQLTFGISDYVATHIKGFVVYPDVYFSKLMKSHLKGHYSPKGVIFLSYKHFKEGYDNSIDGINLGIHEMAHALHFIYIKQFDYSLFFDDIVKKWMQKAVEGKHVAFSNEGDEFLRKYSITNAHEFFAVCVENFFERPEIFYQKLPQVYKHICFILNQNPLKVELISKIKLENKDGSILFQEKISLIPTLVIVSVVVLIYSLLVYRNEQVADSFFYVLLVFLPGVVLKLLTLRKVSFYPNKIIIESFIFKNLYTSIDINRIIYLANYERKGFLNTDNILSFVYFKDGIKETVDIIEPRYKFINKVKEFCVNNDLLYLRK